MSSSIIIRIAIYVIMLVAFSCLLIFIGKVVEKYSLPILLMIPIFYGFYLYKNPYPILKKKMKFGNECILYAAATIAVCALIINTTHLSIEFFSLTMKNIAGYIITTMLATSTLIKLLITYDEYKNS
ncbi:hypothetical protein [Morganella morganii]|uniref:hypothetical protein n=1 Tax=Morganella morganii TaxID=582 RepID=UPI0034D51AA0|nr:hypothetical protein [Morganella morganii]